MKSNDNSGTKAVGAAWQIFTLYYQTLLSLIIKETK